MKRIPIIALAVFALTVGMAPAFANPISPDTFGLSGDLNLFFFIAPSALLLEYLIVRKLLSPWVNSQHALRSFLIANAVTFPPTTILGTAIMWFAEMIPLAIEPQLYKWYLRKIGADVPRLRAKIIWANLASFIVGIIIYHAIFYWMRYF